MTHFATADERGDDLFPAQLERFREFVDEVGRDDLLVHAANSAAALRDPGRHFDMVRCGVAIYGLDPFQRRSRATTASSPRWRCAPGWPRCGASSAGESAGYGRRWTADEPTWVATVPIGYGDGWRRALTNNCGRADPRPPPSARGNGEHGQHHGRARRRTRTWRWATRWS